MALKLAEAAQPMVHGQGPYLAGFARADATFERDVE
jgi:hypothetical protein